MERIGIRWFAVKPPIFPVSVSGFWMKRLSFTPTDTSSDFPSCAFPEWLASQTIYPPAMEGARAAEGEAPRAPGEGAPGAAVAAGRGCTSSPWPREPEPWPFTTRTPSNRTASRSTAPCSSSVRTTSSGSTQSE